VVSPTYRPPLRPREYSWYAFLLNLSRPQAHSAVGRIVSMKNYNDTIGNRTRDLPVRSAVPQPNATPRASSHLVLLIGMPPRSFSPRNGSQSAGSQQPVHQPVSNQTANKPSTRQQINLQPASSSTKRSTFVVSASIVRQSVSPSANKQCCLRPAFRAFSLPIPYPERLSLTPMYQPSSRPVRCVHVFVLRTC
jgi:hypothetical protein